jgi:hypothetical protein
MIADELKRYGHNVIRVHNGLGRADEHRPSSLVARHSRSA